MVLYLIQKTYIEFIQRFYDADVNKKDSIIDNTQRIFQKRYGWSEEECKKVYNQIVEQVLQEANIMILKQILLKKD